MPDFVKCFFNVKNIARVISFLLVFLYMSSERRRMLSVVARPFLKPAWCSAMSPIVSVCVLSRDVRMRSKSLPM